MLKRFITTLTASVSFASASAAEPVFSLGSIHFTAPTGWREAKSEAERIVLRSSDDRQQATISLMRFGAAPSFADFQRLCTLRLQAEKKDAPEAFIEPSVPQPFQEDGRFGLLFSGGEKKTGRIFSCYMSSSGQELVTVYLEAFGVTPKEHQAAFQAFVSSLKHR